MYYECQFFNSVAIEYIIEYKKIDHKNIFTLEQRFFFLKCILISFSDLNDLIT